MHVRYARAHYLEAENADIEAGSTMPTMCLNSCTYADVRLYQNAYDVNSHILTVARVSLVHISSHFSVPVAQPCSTSTQRLNLVQCLSVSRPVSLSY